MEIQTSAWVAMGESLLIGLIVGIERESDREERHAGLRDFVTIGLAGGLCGLLGQAWLTATALAALTAMLIIFRVQTPQRTGITTELAAVVTFLLCVLAASRGLAYGAPLAIALTVVLALFLDAREPLRRLARETLSEQEYWDTLRFLAVIFVILPILPNEDFGPFGGFNAYRTWLFVILVCGINFLGYFFQKFLGGRRSLALTAIVGGLGSSTASTLAFARLAALQPEAARSWAYAAVLANVVLNARAAVILWLVGGPLLAAAWPVLALMTAAGLLWAWQLRRGSADGGAAEPILRLGNPLRLVAGIKFGLLFAAVRFLARAADALYGSSGVFASSAAGGSVDVDAILFSLAGLFREGRVDAATSVSAILVALAANAVVKTALAWHHAGPQFGRQVAAGFAVMFSAACAWIIAKA
ncbi:MAG: DUF4010 domain-containing protein [Bryobacteraceae bacterium]|nr:DUF4010 domain-containing protein [Bryobacteraceae bacterium]MCX7604012.1 DUF4010 domain-containing protein [Bryobacteraceae bacterium]